jgi:putative flippase GtrA
MRKFLLFGLAGGVGFVADILVLYALRGVVGNYGARAVSFVCAVLVTWLINRSFTFAQQRSGVPLWREFLQYLSTMIVGGAVNYAVYVALVALLPVIADHPVIGVAAGALVGMFVNFTFAEKMVFRPR